MRSFTHAHHLGLYNAPRVLHFIAFIIFIVMQAVYVSCTLYIIRLGGLTQAYRISANFSTIINHISFPYQYLQWTVLLFCVSRLSVIIPSLSQDSAALSVHVVIISSYFSIHVSLHGFPYQYLQWTVLLFCVSRLSVIIPSLSQDSAALSVHVVRLRHSIHHCIQYI